MYYQVPTNKWDSVLTQHPEGIIDKSYVGNSETKLMLLGVKTHFTYGIGPAMGMRKTTRKPFTHLLSTYDKPVVLDADGLNILAEIGLDKQHVPPNSILTPHQKEFSRLFGDTANSYDQLDV